METSAIKEMIKQYIKDLRITFNNANEDLTNVDLVEVSELARGLSNAIRVYEDVHYEAYN